METNLPVEVGQAAELVRTDGRVLEAPSVHGQPVLEVRIRNGQIELRKSND